VYHSALKAQINTATALTKARRAEATRLITKGRKLRGEGRALGDTKPDPKALGARLLAQGRDLHSTGMDLLSDAEDGRRDRRHLHLAAALLNGRRYSRCESSFSQNTGPASSSEIAAIIQPHLPNKLKVHAEFIAMTWLDKKDITLRALADGDQLTNQMALDEQRAKLAKAREEEAKLEQEQKWSKVNFDRARDRVGVLQRELASTASRLECLQGSMAELEEEIRRLEGEALKAEVA